MLDVNVLTSRYDISDRRENELAYQVDSKEFS